MAQEVSTVEPRTPQVQSSGDRSAERQVFIPPTDIYETGDAITFDVRDPRGRDSTDYFAFLEVEDHAVGRQGSRLLDGAGVRARHVQNTAARTDTHGLSPGLSA